MFAENCVASSSEFAASGKPPAALENIVCELTWSQRDYLIYALNRYSQLLLGKALTGDAKNEIIELNLELLSVLLSLPLQRPADELKRLGGELKRPGGELRRPNGELKGPNDAPGSEANEVVLDLHWRTRGRLIDSLATNHSLAVLHGHSVAADAKLQLVEQNNELVNILLKLPARLLPNAIDAAIVDDAIGSNGTLDQTEKHFERQYNSRLVKRSEMDEHISILRKEFGEKLAILGGQLAEQRSLLDGELASVCRQVDEQKADLQALKNAGDLRLAVKELENKIRDVDVNRSEAVCQFRLNDATAFLRAGRAQTSEVFFLRGIAWHLNFFTSKGSDGRRHLSVSLNATGPYEVDWAIKVFYFQLAILNETAGKASCSKQGANLIFVKGQRGYGHGECISVDELCSGGFIGADDSLKVKVHLRADKLLLLPDKL